MSELQRTALWETHRQAGARFVPFGGWDMPVQYTSILEEHKAVRNNAGIFDTSHMGQVWVSGAGAAAWLDWILPNDIATLGIGKARYSPMCVEDGGILDDLMVYRLDTDQFLVVVNASRRQPDLEWLQSHARPGVTIDPRYEGRAMIALQGPAARAIAVSLSGPRIADLERFGCLPASFAGVSALVARTGYTGEDGVEIFLDSHHASTVWQALEAAGAVPCGLGARDTLRLEAALPLYGNDIDLTTNPIEAGLGWTVKLAKADFIGRDALSAIAQPARKLVGFELLGRSIARHGFPVVSAGEPVGVVTSGGFAPTLEKSIGLAYVPAALAKPGSTLDIEIRDRAVAAVVVKKPFYQRPASPDDAVATR